MTPGKALAVITIPTARMSAALIAGSVRTTGPFSERRPNARCARTASEADRGDRRGKTHAERNDQGEAEADPMERDRRDQDDERRRAREKACCNAHTEDSLRRELIVVMVMVLAVSVVMAVVVVFVARNPRAEPLAKNAGADRDDEEPGDEREPRVELFGEDELRQAESHEPEREDARGVRDRHGAAEHERMSGGPARTDQVCGDQRLSVTRCQSVRSAPERGDEERKQEDADREIALLDQSLEPSVRVRRRVGLCDGGGCACRVARLEAGPCIRRVERRAQEVLRVGAEHIAFADRGRARLEDARTVARSDGYLAPADPARERFVAEGELRSLA